MTLKTLPRLLSTVYLILSSMLIFACGDVYENVERKHYVLGLHSSDDKLRRQFEFLIDEFNQEAGFDALSFGTSPNQINSSIILTKGLKERDGKVGWGQWIVATETTANSSSKILSTEFKRVHNYTMRLELDEDYVMQRIYSDDEAKKYDLKKLLYHEIGHGFQLDHAPQPGNLMYYDIYGKKDFEMYFSQVRKFFKK
jgi:hypothetical protein